MGAEFAFIQYSIFNILPMKDYYKTLGVQKSASQDEIKKAFRKLAHQHHPDKGGDAEKFKEASEAYQILSDEKKRKEYDTYGSTGPGHGFGGGQGGFDASGFSGFQGGHGFEGVDLNDIFGDFFGGGRREQARRGRDISVDLEISFSEAVFGVEHKVRITKTSACDVCHGSGAKPNTKTKECATCKGKGRIQESVRTILGNFAQERECSACNGSGKIPEEKCVSCKGAGVLRKEEQITIRVPAGIQNGETVRLTGAGEAIKNGKAGDLYVRIHVSEHKVFKRDGYNLVMSLVVRLTDAILGAEYPVHTLDGEIKLKIPKGVSSGEILRVREKGIPIDSRRRGDLLIKLEVKTPTKLSRKAEKLIEELRGEGV
ncbi:MAG TPA: molecular chaperone DnaJ [Candidatus Yonathbacteria bacterium]|nr:molecular chaperone DnaJ [Candidatus Yonathbacteria bacterium]